MTRTSIRVTIAATSLVGAFALGAVIFGEFGQSRALYDTSAERTAPPAADFVSTVENRDSGLPLGSFAGSGNSDSGILIVLSR